METSRVRLRLTQACGLVQSGSSREYEINDLFKRCFSKEAVWIEIDEDALPRIAEEPECDRLLKSARQIFIFVATRTPHSRATAYFCGPSCVWISPAEQETVLGLASGHIQMPEWVQRLLLDGPDVCIHSTRCNADEWVHIVSNITCNTRAFLHVLYQGDDLLEDFRERVGRY